MDKIDLNSRDILGGNVEKIAELFPGVVTEAKDEATGELKKVVDFDLLRQHLSDELVEGDRERFRLDWPGKKASILKANTPIHKTLRPVREDSEGFDTTENVFIEGDNFEVLKVLQESYLGKVKMIYIDPPYNTGKDFIYRDNFTQGREDYEEEIGVRDDESGGKLVKNTETNGRYHSDWLSMMQERLIVARDLLTDDGVIFISIDDNEQANLKELADEIFGESNFVADFVWTKKQKASGVPPVNMILTNKEHVLCYQRLSDIKFSGQARSMKSYKQDAGGRWWRLMPIQATGAQNSYFTIIDPDTGNEYYGNWAFSENAIKRMIDEKKIAFPKSGKGLPTQIVYADEMKNDSSPIFEYLGLYESEISSKSLIKLMEGKLFDFPKPIDLIKFFIYQATDTTSTVLDFFSGSGTTAHAVMRLNAEDGGNRKHIQVQLAEPTDEDSEAYKAGYKSIPEISRERIRRAGKKIRETHAEQIAKRDTPLDTGFRAFKLSSSNFKDTAKHPDQIDQTSLLADTDSIKTDRTADDLLTEVILSLGLTLDLPIETRDIAGHTVYFVGGNSLVACFDDSISLDIVDDIAAEKPLRVVFRDSSFSSDETRINIDIRLKQLSPDTTVQVV
jgi:adenine-specific DNA-methyltransferase